MKEPKNKSQSAALPSDEKLAQLIDRAEIEHAAEKYESALRIGKQVLRLEKDNLPACAVCADSLVKLERPKEVVEIVQRAGYGGLLAEDYPQVPSGIPARFVELLLRAHWQAIRDMGDLQAALAIATQKTQTDPNRWTPRVVDALLRMQKFDQAEAMLSGAKGVRQALSDIGIMLTYLKNFKVAATYFARHLAFCSLPSQFEALQSYVECLRLAGRSDEAQQICMHWVGRITERRSYEYKFLRLFITLIESGSSGVHSDVDQEPLRLSAGSLRRLVIRLQPFEETVAALYAMSL